MKKNRMPYTADTADEVVGTVQEEKGTHLFYCETNLISEAVGDPKKTPEIEPEKRPKEDPGIPQEEPDEDDDDDDPNIEPPIGDDPEKEKSKLPVMLA